MFTLVCISIIITSRDIKPPPPSSYIGGGD